VCRALKEIDSVKHIPVVILSAKGQDDEIETGKAAGAIDYILKPFDMAELQQRVNEILSKIGAS
jgi:DNA-binding response OmpR family regulator